MIIGGFSGQGFGITKVMRCGGFARDDFFMFRALPMLDPQP